MRYVVLFLALGACNTVKEDLPGQSRIKAEAYGYTFNVFAADPDFQVVRTNMGLPKRDTFALAVAAAVKDVTGKEPELSTSGGTSDARFIRKFCPVVEFGIVGQTMHKTDEHVMVADIEALTTIYEAALEKFFDAARA